jgi:spore germination protein KB
MYFGILLGGLTIFLAFFRNLFVLGMPLENTINYPSYESASILSIGEFITRTEGLVASNLVIAGFVKISICLMVASKGVAKLFVADDYRYYVVPLGLLMVAFAGVAYASLMEMIDFLNVYKYYALPFEIFIPFALCIVVEVKLLVNRPKQTQ